MSDDTESGGNVGIRNGMTQRPLRLGSNDKKLTTVSHPEVYMKEGLKAMINLPILSPASTHSLTARGLGSVLSSPLGPGEIGTS